jgi:hypothetical protein
MKLKTETLFRVAVIAALIGLGAWYVAPAFKKSGTFAGLGATAIALIGMVAFEYYRPEGDDENDKEDENAEED